MRLCYVVQRYGADIAGGAEQHCREIVERMVARGHDVEVVTTCAVSYRDWANALPAGTQTIAGVTVHRFPVEYPRDPDWCDRFTDRIVSRPVVVPIEIQREWMRRQGPYVPALGEWLDAHASTFDAVVCFTYLYWPTWRALSSLPGVVPVVLHPTVHEEPVLDLSIFDEVFRRPDAFALSVAEEAELIARRFHIAVPGAVVGVGAEAHAADPARFRAAYPVLGDAPYLLCAGRLDAGKGALELLDYFRAYRQLHPTPLRLVFLGDPLTTIEPHDDVLVTGFVNDQLRDDAIAGALALAQPSYFESFSMVLVEAFAHGRPALVQRRCAVTTGHARRSGAAIPYDGFAEFEAAVDRLVHDAGLAATLGERGRAYAAAEYTWEVVLDRCEALLGAVAAGSSPEFVHAPGTLRAPHGDR